MQCLRTLYPVKRIEEIYAIYFRHKTFIDELFELMNNLRPILPNFDDITVFTPLNEVSANDPKEYLLGKL